MSAKLRDLIRAVRACKTAAEERAVLQRESAFVRQQLSAGTNRGTCMLKMMYMTMLGYSTEFGQMEVVKLLAETDFASKRIGYLTLCVLMDENQQVLTLAENHMKRDLVNTSNPFVQGLALDSIANIAGEDMARDMLNELLTLCNSGNAHLKKKAALAAQRAVRKAPELVDVFLEDERLMSMFSERNHGVLLCNLALLNECLAQPAGQPFVKKYAALIPGAVRHLSGLVLSAFANEYEIGGVADPFLQVKLLTFLRIVGRDSEEAAEAMNNVLAQTATNTSMDRNVGSAVLYECVRTILAIQCDSSLRMLAYNILGRFMDRDNNCRFVALSTFLNVVQIDKSVAQRHRTTVLDCLKDVDTSIRRRALQLTVALVDDSNVRLMAADLLAYLAVCAEELKEETAQHICHVIEHQSPTDEWRVEMSIKLFRNMLARIPTSFAVSFIGLITRCDPEQQQRSAFTLWEDLTAALADEASLKNRTAFLLAAVWVVGEYCTVLATSPAMADNLLSALGTLVNECGSAQVQQYAVNATMKIASRFLGCAALARSIFESCTTSMNVELQQRAAEYTELLQLEAELVGFCFSCGGPISATAEDGDDVLSFTLPKSQASPVHAAAAHATATVAPRAAPAVDILDSLFGGPPAAGGGPSSGSGLTTMAGAAAGGGAAAAAPWDRIFDTAAPVAAPVVAAPPSMASLFESLPPAPIAPRPAPTAVPGPVAPVAPSAASSSNAMGRTNGTLVFEATDFNVYVSAAAKPGSPSDLSVIFFVTSRGPALSNVLLSIAVTKTCTLSMGVCAQDSVAPHGTLEQPMIVHGPPAGHTRLAMMVKMVYRVGPESRVSEFKFAKDLPL